MSIHVEFPEELLAATREDPQAFARKVMIYTLGHLYEQGKISPGIGAQVLVHFLKTCGVRAFPGSVTLQRGFWSRAGARRSQDNAQELLWRCTRM